MKASREIIETLKAKMGWYTLEGSARKWWLAFEMEKAERPEVVLALLTELEKRQATIEEFFLAYIYSESDNIQTNLEYLDLAIERSEKIRPLSMEDFKALRN
jgi:hypothetical protein